MAAAKKLTIELFNQHESYYAIPTMSEQEVMDRILVPKLGEMNSVGSHIHHVGDSFHVPKQEGVQGIRGRQDFHFIVRNVKPAAGGYYAPGTTEIDLKIN